LAEKLPYSQICGTKVGPPEKNGVEKRYYCYTVL